MPGTRDMLPLEKNLVNRLGDSGWVLYWLPRLHTLSKIYAVKSPPYRREAFSLTKKIDTDVNSHYQRQRSDLDWRKDLPIDDSKHLSRERYQRGIALINKKRDEQKTTFLKDNIEDASREVELNLMWDAFEAGLAAYASGDYSLATGFRFLRAFIEQDNPPKAPETTGSLFYHVRRAVKRKRREWVPKEAAYMEDFIRTTKGYFVRLARIAFWDGVDYHATLKGDQPPKREIRNQANATELSNLEIVKMMDAMYFKFEHNPEFPVARRDYEKLKGLVTANYNYSKQVTQIAIPGEGSREFYKRPVISSIRKG